MGVPGRPLPWSVGTGRSPGSNGGRWVFWAGHYHGQWGQEEVLVQMEVGGCSGRPLPLPVGTERSRGSNGGSCKDCVPVLCLGSKPEVIAPAHLHH